MTDNEGKKLRYEEFSLGPALGSGDLTSVNVVEVVDVVHAVEVIENN
jgi:hypothetical protein